MTDRTVQLPTAPPVLQMCSITKRFPGVLANDGVDLELYAGEVLALLGENGAGKSTLMNILAGLYRPDAGEILILGQPAAIHSPRDAALAGIGMVHQNFMLVPTMTVAQNIVLGMADLPFIPDLAAIEARIRELSARYGLQVDPRAYIWQLGVGEQQRVEILKLIYRGADIVILDEPTAVLTPQEAQDLGRILEVMQAEGKSIVFITHKMAEVIAFSDRVCVLRQGRVVATKRTADTNPRELARLMVGREVLFRLNKRPAQPGEPVLTLDAVHATNDKGLPALQGVSLEARQGEILGIAGVAGNGQQELAEVITGLRLIKRGKLVINQRDLTHCSSLEAIRAGVSHIPADRVGMGSVGDMPVADNIVMKAYRLPPLAQRGVLNRQRILNFARVLIDIFQIATPTPQTHVKFLSGGNIQKTILAREIDACTDLLVAVYPSRGLDVGATEAVRRRLLEQRDDGRAVLLISEDLDELRTVADRIAVLYEGRVMGVVDAEEADVETLGLMMAGAVDQTVDGVAASPHTESTRPL
ncbi:MAG: ABC transporter ATP-binding protein [Anaerolineae bacterium]|nr:ABC transporter ATP-binding protein [Anaerolineae bacterium]